MEDLLEQTERWLAILIVTGGDIGTNGNTNLKRREKETKKKSQ
jgi:hypothetical protein